MNRASVQPARKIPSIQSEILEQRRLLSASVAASLIAQPANQLPNGISVIAISYVPAPPPVAGPVTTGTLRNQQDIINVLASASATTPAVVIAADVMVATAPSHGSAVPESNGSIAYTPAAGFTGTDTFTYTVEDNNANTSAPGTVTVTVEPPGTPIAGSVNATTPAGSAVTVSVLSSDTAVSPATLVPADVAIVTVPSHGTAVAQSDGTILYTPATNYFGTDSLTYTVEDTNGEISNAATVSIVVSPPPVPIAGAVSAALFEGSAVTVNVLSSDSATAPATLIPADVHVATQPLHGTAVAQSDGTILYTPGAAYAGADSFTYTVQDTSGQTSSPGTVTIAVNLPAAPTAGAVSSTAVAGIARTINVLAGSAATSPATLVPGNVQIATMPSHGTAAVQEDGSILYTPAIGYAGGDSFTYTVQDNLGQVSVPDTVSLTVSLPTPPSAGPVTATTGASAPVTISVLSSDTAAQGTLNPASVAVATGPAHGTAVAQGDGTILYTPTAHYTGTDSFTYTISDSLGGISAPATVSITITPGVPPVAPTVVAPVIGGQTNDIDVLSHFTGGAPLVPSSVTVVTSPTGGTAIVNPSTGAISYVPSAGFVGTDTFTYTVADVNGGVSAPATVSVNVGTTIASTGGSAHSLTFTSAAGGVETITLTKGSAELYFSGTGGSVSVGKNLKAVVTGTNLELSGISLSATTAGSVLSIKGPAGAPVTIGGITDNSPMGSIVASQAVVSGVMSFAGLGVMTVNSISSGTIGIGGGGPARFTLTSGAITNSSLYSAEPIASLKAAAWSGQSNASSISIAGTSTSIRPGIVAPSITTLTIAGSFDPDVTLTANARSFALGVAKITGAVSGGTWSIPGPTNSISAGSIAPSWQGACGNLNSMTIRAGGLSSLNTSALSAGVLGSLVINGDLTTSISATSARIIRVTGNIEESNIAITGSLGQLTATGSLVRDNIVSGGNLTSLSAAAMNTTLVEAGVAGTVTFATANSANLGAATIGTIRLTGRSGIQFTDSQIMAGRINTASLGSVITSNGGVHFGIAARYVGTFAGMFNSATLHLPHSALVSSMLLSSYLQQQGVTFGDFAIAIEV